MRLSTRLRTINTWYEDALGAEHDISIEVEAEGLREIAICTVLPDMPAVELTGLRERLAEAYWAAEHEAYLASPQAERDGL